MQKKGEADRFVDWFYSLIGDMQEALQISERQATVAVQLIVDRVQHEYGGRKVYVHAPSRRQQIINLWREGWNIEKIATHLDVSVSWVLRVVREV